jgi:NADPH:quinone reductase-like Zn-dependent oxidoreductase
MKALRFSKFGPPSVPAIEEVRRPEPGDGEVLVHEFRAAMGAGNRRIRETNGATLERPFVKAFAAMPEKWLPLPTRGIQQAD